MAFLEMFPPLNGFCLAGDGGGIHAVWAGFRAGIGVPCKDFRHGIEVGVESLFPSDFLSGVGSHAAHNGGEGGLGGVVGVVDGFVLVDVFDEHVVFGLVGVVVFTAEPPDDLAGEILDDAGGGAALGADDRFGDLGPSSVPVFALAVHGGAVGVGVFDVVVVVDFAPVLADALGATADAVGLDGNGTLEPVADVEVVDVLFADVVAADPVEVVPVAHLVFHFRHAFFAWAGPDAAAGPVDL